MLDWIYAKLGFDPAVFEKFENLSAARNFERVEGSAVASLDLLSGEERILWQCGRCWGPAIVDKDRIAVLKRDGLWLISDGAPPSISIESMESGVRFENSTLLGRSDAPAATLILLEEQVDRPECWARVWEVNLAEGRLARPADAPAPCVEPLGGLRPGQVRNEMAVFSRSSPPLPRRLYVGRAGEREHDRLTPNAQGAQPHVSDRFYPLWRSDSEIIYLID